MENIINFPTKSVRDWLIVERELKQQLSGFGFPTSANNRLVQVMKDFFEILDPDFNFSIQAPFSGALSPDQRSSICADIGEQMGVLISERLQAFTQKLFFDRLHREIDICLELGMM